MLILYLIVAWLYGACWSISAINDSRYMNEPNRTDLIIGILFTLVMPLWMPIALIFHIDYEIKVYKEYGLPDYQKVYRR